MPFDIGQHVPVLDQIPSQWVGKVVRDFKGTDPADSADSRARAEKILARIAASYKNMTFLPLTESYSDETSEMRQAYRKMLRDSTVKAAVLTKLMAVCQLDPQVHPASDQGIDEDAAEFVRFALAKCKGGTRRMLASVILGALLDGFSVCEKIWQVEKRGRWTGKYRLAQLKSKDTEYIDLQVDEFRNVTGIRDRRTQRAYHPSNFVVYTHMPLFESPAGMSDLRAAYRAYWLMDTAWKLRAVALERFTLPMLKGTYEDDDQKPELEAALAAARAQAWVSIPKGALIEALELSTKGTSDFQAAINDLKEEIVLGITGAVLQMLQGQVSDGRGDTTVHKSTAELLQWWLAAEAGDVISDQVVPDLVTFNFAEADFPTVTFGGVNDAAMVSSLSIDEGLHRIGVPLSRKEMYKRYGRQEPSDDTDAIQPQADAGAGPLGMAPGGNYAGPAFAEPAPAPTAKDIADKSKAIMELQKAYFIGELTREAAAANARVAMGLTPEDAESLFPIVTEDDVTKASEGDEPTSTATKKPTVVPAPKPVVRQAEPEKKKPEPAPAKPAERDVAGSIRDADKVQELLNAAERRGIAVLDHLTRQAVTRLLSTADPTLRLRLFDDAERKQIADVLASVNATANLFGQAKVHLQKQRAEREHAAGVTKFSDEPLFVEKFAEPLKPLAPQAALGYFNRLVPSLNPDAARFGDAMRRQSFTLAAATDLKILDRVKRVISQATEHGTVIKGPERIQQILDQAGISVRNPQYSEMVFRTNMMDNYTTGQTQALQDPDIARYFPCWQYMGIRDGRQGEDHEPHFGKFYPTSVPFSRVRGERVFNCRCNPRGVSKWEWRALEAAGAKIEQFP